MLPAEDLFACVYVLVDDAIKSGLIAIPRRPGPAAARAGAGLLAIAPVRHLPGRRGEAGFLAGVSRDWPDLFPRPPRQSEADRRIRWLRGAFGYCGVMLAARLPEDDCQQTDTSAIPVRHASRVRGPDQRAGPGNDLTARFGRDAARAEWSCGFRRAIRTDPGSRIVRAWSIAPAAVSEREVAIDLPEGGVLPRDLLADKGFSCRAFTAPLAALGIAPLVPHARDQRASEPSAPLKVIAERRNRAGTSYAEITDRMELARHGARTLWGPLTRTTATTAARTPLRVCPAGQ